MHNYNQINCNCKLTWACRRWQLAVTNDNVTNYTVYTWVLNCCRHPFTGIFLVLMQGNRMQPRGEGQSLSQFLIFTRDVKSGMLYMSPQICKAVSLHTARRLNPGWAVLPVWSSHVVTVLVQVSSGCCNFPQYKIYIYKINSSVSVSEVWDHTLALWLSKECTVF